MQKPFGRFWMDFVGIFSVYMRMWMVFVLFFLNRMSLIFGRECFKWFFIVLLLNIWWTGFFPGFYWKNRRGKLMRGRWSWRLRLEVVNLFVMYILWWVFAVKRLNVLDRRNVRAESEGNSYGFFSPIFGTVSNWISFRIT